MKSMLFRGVAFAALMVPGAAFAQSTGSVDFEEDDAIVVTGSRTDRGVGGVITPDTTKAKQVLTQETIERQNPGQTILDTINVVPGVNFTNNDAYGSSGGQLTIRGFSADRISLTFDGVPLNDSGNYAIYSNQQLDPELIEQVNVNLGSTDVDSPTAAASGSTVNYRTIVPSEELGAMLSASIGEYNFFRVFGKLELGEFTPWGTRMFVAASKATNDNPFNNYGRVDKQQFNARIWQPIGGEGDFISVAGNYNQNRNNFFGSVPLRLDANRVVGAGSGNRFPLTNDEREYNINFPCSTFVAARPGVADAATSCGTEFDRRYNPSNTGNIRGSSRFTFGQFTLTVDPSYQYVKANGGGTVAARERLVDVAPGAAVNNITGYVGGRPYFGRDLNGDGDLLDEVTLLAPSQTQTHRYGVIAGLRYDINDEHTVRLAYSWDRARHRQTGEVGGLQVNGEPLDVFPVNGGLTDVTGATLQKRDRLSYAILHQIAGEYRGEFGPLVVNLGLRAPFFRRELNNYCFTTSDSGFVDCFGEGNARNATYAGLNPTVQGPQQRVLNYSAVLPNAGLTYDLTDALSLFGNYSRGIQVPGTDALYNSFFFAPDSDAARPEPETSDNFDLGLRYRSGRVQAQLSGWYTRYENRLASAFDEETQRTVYRNLGRVDKYGLDGSVSFAPSPNLVLYAFGSYLWSDIKEDIRIGTVNGQPVFAPTAGKREAGAPVYTYGATARGILGPLELGVTAKRTGERYLFDTNVPVIAVTNNVSQQVYPAATDPYWLVNLDARLSLAQWGLERTFVQLNVYNLFDELYVGSYQGGLYQTSFPNAQIGAPRTVSATLSIGF